MESDLAYTDGRERHHAVTSPAFGSEAGRGRPVRKAALRRVLMGPMFALALLLCFACALASAGEQTTPCGLLALQDPPVADAGDDVTIDAGETVHFDGTGSSDDVGIANYTWTFTYDDRNWTYYSSTFDFAFAVEGTYDVVLNVTDDDGHFDTDVVVVTVLQDPPVAVAGNDLTVVAGEPVYFDASGSSDDVGIADYTWSLSYRGLNRTFSGATFNFTFAQAGTYNVTLTVVDVAGQTDTDVVQVIVLPKPVDYLATYWWLIPIVGGIVLVVVFVDMAMKGKIGFISEPRREKLRLEVLRQVKIVRQLLGNMMGLFGIIVLVFFILMGIFGRAIAPYPVDIFDPAAKFPKNLPPSAFAMDAPDYVVPLKLAFPIALGLLLAVGLFVWGMRRGFAEKYGVDMRCLMLSIVVSAFLAVFVAMHALSVLEIESSEWFVPASIVGTCLVICAFSLAHARSSRRMLASLVLAIVAPVVVAVPVFTGLDGDALLESLGFFEGVAAIMLVASALVSRSARLNILRRNPALLGTDEGANMKKAGRIVIALGIALAAGVMIGGLLSAMQANWTEHWMGTDSLGYDIYSELLYGASTSIIVGIISAIIASVVGAGVGLYSGYAGGWKDEVVMRANDVVLSIPWLVLMIIIAGMLETITLTGIIIVIGFTGWSPTARMVRSQVLSLKERQYVERARAIGASDMNIIRRHVLPNAFPLVFANTILIVAVSILSESTLSFLGLRPVGTVTWGTMLSYASDVNAINMGLYWWIMAPGLCIVFIVLGFTLVGYALDDILNPRLRKR